MPESMTRSAELVLDAKVYVYVDLEGRRITHVEVDYDRQPSSYDGPEATSDEAWKIALRETTPAAWPTPSWT
jgi:hypothetical protein